MIGDVNVIAAIPYVIGGVIIVGGGWSVWSYWQKRPRANGSRSSEIDTQKARRALELICELDEMRKSIDEKS